jgi:hypothetical protein
VPVASTFRFCKFERVGRAPWLDNIEAARLTVQSVQPKPGKTTITALAGLSVSHFLSTKSMAGEFHEVRKDTGLAWIIVSKLLLLSKIILLPIHGKTV